MYRTVLYCKLRPFERASLSNKRHPGPQVLSLHGEERASTPAGPAFASSSFLASSYKKPDSQSLPDHFANPRFASIARPYLAIALCAAQLTTQNHELQPNVMTMETGDALCCDRALGAGSGWLWLATSVPILVGPTRW